MVFCKLSPPWGRYLEFFDKEGAVSPSLHRLDLSFEGHIPFLILVPYNNVLLCLVTGYGAGDCKSILYSCDRKAISRLYWSPLPGRTGLFQAILIITFRFNCNYLAWFAFQRTKPKQTAEKINHQYSSSRILFPHIHQICSVPDMNVSGSDRCQFRLIKKVSISAMITFVYV